MAQTERVEGNTLRVMLELRGNSAREVNAIVAREGNAVAAVCRRLISVGLTHEPKEHA
jgi:hypothetical protein